MEMVTAMNPVDLMGFVAIFSFSFAASLHCAFMCSPLVCAAVGDRAKINQPGIWLYNLGRLASYVSAGLVLGYLGSMVEGRWPSISKSISTVLGILIIAFATSKAWELLFARPLFKFNMKRSLVSLQSLFRSKLVLPFPLKDFLLGAFTVFLPCMTLTPALTAAAGTADPIKGSLYMLAFALGTLPVMLGATYVPLLIYRKVPDFVGKVAVVVFLLLTGIITLMR